MWVYLRVCRTTINRQKGRLGRHEAPVRNSQVCPNIPSSGFDKRGSVGPSRVHDDLVANVVGQDVVVLVEGIYSSDVKVEEVGRPGRVQAIDGAIGRKCKVDAR